MEVTRTARDWCPVGSTLYFWLRNSVPGDRYNLSLAADHCQDIGCRYVGDEVYDYESLGMVLREYSRFESYHRLGLPVLTHDILAYDELNASEKYGVRDHFTTADNKFHYSGRVGCFHTKLNCTSLDLAANLDAVSDQLVRHVNLVVDGELALILRNYRMAQLTTLTISDSRARDGLRPLPDKIFASTVKEALMEAQLPNCMEVKLQCHPSDTLVIKTAFMVARAKGIGRGCRLAHNGTRILV